MFNELIEGPENLKLKYSLNMIIKRKICTVQEHPDQEAQEPYLQSHHSNLKDGLQDNQHFQQYCHFICYLRYPGQVGNQPLQEGTNTIRKVFTTEGPKICSYPVNHPCQRIYLHYYCGSSLGR